MSEQRSFRRPDIQGLRALAVALVVSEHVLGQPVAGFVGVDVFFVISGFLIVGLLVAEHDRTGRIDLVAFAGRRVRRLLPAAVVVTGSTLLAVFVLWPTGRAVQVAIDAGWSAALVANWHFAAQGTDYFTQDGPVSPLQHLWSLSVEEQFYLVVPAALVVTLAVAKRSAHPRRAATILLGVIVIASFSWALSSSAQNAPDAYFSSFTRAWELGAGGLVAMGGRVWERIPPRLGHGMSWLGLAMIAGGAVVLTGDHGFPAPAAGIPVVGAVLVVIGGRADGSASPLLIRLGAVCALGTVSYSLYLWHFPVFVVIASSDPAAAWIAIPLSLALAGITHQLIERPFTSFPTGAFDGTRAGRRSLREWSRATLRGARFPGLAGVALSTAMLVVLAVGQSRPLDVPTVDVAAGSAPDRVGAAQPEIPGLEGRQRALRQALNATSWPDTTPSIDDVSAPGYLESLPRARPWSSTLSCSSHWDDESLDRCTFGDPTGKTMLVVGDSTAAFTTPALRVIVERPDSGWRIVIASRFGCPWATADLTFDGNESACRDHKESIMRLAKTLRPDVILAINLPSTTVEGPDGRIMSHQDWGRDLATLAEKTPGIRTVGLVPNPVGPDIRECANSRSAPGRCLARPNANRARASALGESIGTENVIDSTPAWCVDGACPAFVDSQLVRVDVSHAHPGAMQSAGDALRTLMKGTKAFGDLG